MLVLQSNKRIGFIVVQYVKQLNLPCSLCCFCCTHNWHPTLRVLLKATSFEHASLRIMDKRAWGGSARARGAPYGIHMMDASMRTMNVSETGFQSSKARKHSRVALLQVSALDAMHACSESTCCSSNIGSCRLNADPILGETFKAG